MPLIQCENAAFSYEGAEVARGLNFSVSEGDYLCIVGENGAGKSTLVKGLLHLKAPSAGRITLCGGLKKNEIGYLPQQSAMQKNFPASIFEVVLSGRLNSRGFRPFYSEEDRSIARQNLALLGLPGMEKQGFNKLSGGQQRRVLLARALCATKSMLVLDEPVAGLDPAASEDMYALIEKINRTMGIAIVMVSHDIQSALRYAKHILHLQHRQLFYGTPDAYRHSEAAHAWQKEQPYV